jgi:hypothetical protein
MKRNKSKKATPLPVQLSDNWERDIGAEQDAEWDEKTDPGQPPENFALRECTKCGEPLDGAKNIPHSEADCIEYLRDRVQAQKTRLAGLIQALQEREILPRWW